MDGERIQNYWSDEVDALVRTYRQFEKLIPSERVDGAAHLGEDGRYVEDLVREYLRHFYRVIWRSSPALFSGLRLRRVKLAESVAMIKIGILGNWTSLSTILPRTQHRSNNL